MKSLKYILPLAIVLFSIVIAVVIVKSKKQIVQEAPDMIPPQIRVMTAKKEAVQMFFYTVIWLFTFTMATFLLIAGIIS